LACCGAESISPRIAGGRGIDAHFASYLKKAVAALEAPRTVYAPDLAKLEGMLRSITIR